MNWSYRKKDLKDFWVFVYNRHGAYRRRFVEKKPPPWSDDPIIRRYFFTNVYRELDRGTQFLLEEILPNRSFRDLVWRVLVYRVFNRIETYEALDHYGLLAQWSTSEATDFLRARKVIDKLLPFTGAFMVTGSIDRGAKDKVGNYCCLIGEWYADLAKIAERFKRTKSLKELWQAICQIDGFGPFLAYEVAIDLNYSKYFNFSEDNFVNPGPGCRRGIRRITTVTVRSGPEYVEVITDLRKNQRGSFLSYRLDFPYWEGKEMTLRNIEHSLCEYHKWARIRDALCSGRSPKGGARVFRWEEKSHGSFTEN